MRCVSILLYYYPLGRVWSRGHSEKSLSITAIVAEVRDMKVSLVYDIRPQITTGGSANYMALYVGMTVIYVKNQNVAIYFKSRELMDIHHRAIPTQAQPIE